MIAPTHIAFAAACGTLGGASGHSIVLLCAGSLLPDADIPTSFVGRIFPFISIPLSKRFGHRRAVHSFVLWSLVATLGYYLWDPLYWLGLGALSHVVVDLLNVSGVRLLLPFSEKVCVLFSRQFRFPVASRTELGWLVAFVLLAWFGTYLHRRTKTAPSAKNCPWRSQLVSGVQRTGSRLRPRFSANQGRHRRR